MNSWLALWSLPYQCGASHTATQCPGVDVSAHITNDHRWKETLATVLLRGKTEQLGHKSYFQSFAGEGGVKSDEDCEYRNINKILAMRGKTYNILCCSVFTPVFWEWSSRPARQYFCSCSHVLCLLTVLCLIVTSQACYHVCMQDSGPTYKPSSAEVQRWTPLEHQAIVLTTATALLQLNTDCKADLKVYTYHSYHAFSQLNVLLSFILIKTSFFMLNGKQKRAKHYHSHIFKSQCQM